MKNITRGVYIALTLITSKRRIALGLNMGGRQRTSLFLGLESKKTTEEEEKRRERKSRRKRSR